VIVKSYDAKSGDVLVVADFAFGQYDRQGEG